MSVDYNDHSDEIEEHMVDYVDQMLDDYSNETSYHNDDFDGEDYPISSKHVLKSEFTDLPIYASAIHVIISAIIFIVALLKKCVLNWTNWTDFLVVFTYVLITLVIWGMITICLIVSISIFFDKNCENCKTKFSKFKLAFIIYIISISIIFLCFLIIKKILI